MNTQELSKVCRQVRRDIITMTANAIRWFMVKERWRVLSSPVVAEPSAVIKSEAVYAA